MIPVQVAALSARPRSDLGHQPAADDPRDGTSTPTSRRSGPSGASGRSFARRRRPHWSVSRCPRQARTSRSSRTRCRGSRPTVWRRPPFENDWSPDAGVDVKYGLTKSLTADFTYNTDFAQVEVDEAQVNLTRFNLQFPEKRDFFLESAGHLHVRRRGRRRRRAMRRRSSTAVASACRAPPPFPSTSGARLSGRVGRYSIGALNIGTDEIGVVPGVPATNFTVVRVRRDVLQRSTIGRVVHEPLGLDGGGPEATRSSVSTPTSRCRRTSASAATRRRREPSDGQATRSATGRTSTTPPTATACSSIEPSSGTTSIRKWDFSAGAGSGATSGRRDSVHGPAERHHTPVLL